MTSNVWPSWSSMRYKEQVSSFDIASAALQEGQSLRVMLLTYGKTVLGGEPRILA